MLTLFEDISGSVEVRGWLGGGFVLSPAILALHLTLEEAFAWAMARAPGAWAIRPVAIFPQNPSITLYLLHFGEQLVTLFVKCKSTLCSSICL